LGHVPGFDGIRGLFVLFVVTSHARLTDTVLPGDHIIIDLFFVMSGFLITTLLLDELQENGNLSLRMFYTRRVLRLFPAMYLMIGAFVVVMTLVQLFAAQRMEEGHWWGLEAAGASLYSYHFAAAFFPDNIGGLIGHTWSLSVEEQFYFLWPALFFLTMRAVLKPRGADARERRIGADRWLVLGAIAFVVAGFTIRFLFQDVAYLEGAEMRYTDVESVTARGVAYRLASFRPDMIVVGCLLAIGARHIPRPVPEAWLRRLRVGAIVCWGLFFTAMVGVGRIPGFTRFGGPLYQLAMLGVAVITLDLFLRTESRKSRLLSTKPLRTIGLRSYGIYVWHVPVLWFFLLIGFNEAYGIRGAVLGTAAAVLGVAAGFASFKYIEKPFLRLKTRKYQRVSDGRDDLAEGGSPRPGSAPATVDLRQPAGPSGDGAPPVTPAPVPSAVSSHAPGAPVPAAGHARADLPIEPAAEPLVDAANAAPTAPVAVGPPPSSTPPPMPLPPPAPLHGMPPAANPFS
jgi:peptidoglycan/LPS O-acetylase OafA/YrhL